MEYAKLLLVFTFCLLEGCMSSRVVSRQRDFQPPDGRILLIVGQDDRTVETYIKETGIVPGGFMIYTSIQTMEGLDGVSKDYGSGTCFTDKLIEKYPDTVIQIGLYMVDALDDTLKGKYDKNIRHLEKWAKKVRIPIFLRIGYECDGSHNHYDPDQYTEAYRYIVDKLNSSGVDNIAYVWHVHGHGTDQKLDDYYPGDAYVDWIAFSYFDQPQDMMEPAIRFARDHKKPLMIGESTPRGIGTRMDKISWEAWFKNYFQFIKEHNIKIISYINSNWENQPMWKDQGWGDARVQADAFVKEKWIEEISQDMYLHSSKELFKILGYEKE
ncbi:MAG: hypothetical protein JW928_03945 [Candidatus Aureabacteria bacterium]|nr:hypothetical protein [Candidatus Auribacterota bacterium]